MQSLEQFGFTPTECKVYESLLRSGPSTGYSIAKTSGLARANAYQALDALVRRGAARRAPTVPARYSALSPDGLIAELERTFRRDLDSLQHALRSLPRLSTATSPIVTHDTWNAFVGAVVTAIGESRTDVLAVAGPWAAEVLDALGESREGTVRAVSLGAPAPSGIPVRTVEPAELVSYWTGFPLAVVVDRKVAFSGIVQSDGEGAGIETSSPSVVPFIRHLLRRETSSPGAGE